MQSSDFANRSYDYRPNWTPLSPFTIINYDSSDCLKIAGSYCSLLQKCLSQNISSSCKGRQLISQAIVAMYDSSM